MEASGASVLGTRDKYVDAREVMQATCVVGMQVGQHEPAHVALWVNAERVELRADLLLGVNPFLHGEAEVRLPAWEITRLTGARRLASIHDDDTLGVFDDPGVDGQWLRPATIERSVESADGAVSPAATPVLRDGDGPGLDGMNAHGG